MFITHPDLNKGLRFLFLLILFLLGPWSPITAQERRVALVIGNGSYSGLQNLQNPVRDAEAIGQSLSALGFTVFLTTEVDQVQFRKALKFFLSRAADADTSLFYFAGHGATLAGQTHLFPTDFGKDGFFDMNESINLNEIVTSLNSELRNNLVFIDACRNNPLQSGTAETISLSQQPASLNQARVGTVISFATTPGQTAFDGAGVHSPFTGALLDHLDTPGIDIELMLKRVRRDVVVNTRGLQVPWTESSLLTSLQMAPQKKLSSQSDVVGQPGKVPSILAVLSDTGFNQKPILDVISNGLGQPTNRRPSFTETQEQYSKRRSQRIKELLCSVIARPLPPSCQDFTNN